MNYINFHIIEDLETELATKYLYIGLAYMMIQEGVTIMEVDNDMLSSKLGITNARLYRARGNLVKLGAIKHSKKFCPETGRKISDVYELEV